MQHASLRAMLVFGTLLAMLFAAGASVPTPLYPLYQQAYALAPMDVTLIFAVYVAFLLGSLLVVGRLSSHLGRKPVIAGALVLNLLAVACFLHADSYGGLLLARSIQGLAMGIAVPTCGAAIVDADNDKGPVLNSYVPFIGMSLGALCTGMLVSWAPMPMLLPYLLIGVLTALALVVLAFMPETHGRRPGAWRSLVPDLGVPPQARAAFVRLMPPVMAGWALGGLYMSLMPGVLREVLDTDSQMVTGIIVCVLMGSAAVAVYVGRQRPALRMMMIGAILQLIGIPVTLVGMELGLAAPLFFGTIISGAGQGLIFSSILRLLLPLAAVHERAGMLSVFFAVSYCAFALPAVLAGVAVQYLGLLQVAVVYGLVVMGGLMASIMGLRGACSQRC
ncbi:MFS transporter [Falsirhodobacter deserti]|uniref:MFS transporter n=1 Tax=Falsirhodobacter deserti TaxID=1365611 RepID=UPI0013E36EB7|nr:MFS transporter [Falsirhodobacter deserti]